MQSTTWESNLENMKRNKHDHHQIKKTKKVLDKRT